MHQYKLTLNMLRRSRVNLKMSTYNQLFGLFDYNRTPLVSLGTTAFVHETLGQQASNADHGRIGFVVGPYPHHYRHMNFL